MSYGFLPRWRTTTTPQKRAVYLRSLVVQRKAQARAAAGTGNWRQVGAIRQQITALRAQLLGILTRQATLRKPWAVLMLRQFRTEGAYRPVDLPRTHYSSWQRFYPQTAYRSWQSYWPQPSYTRAYRAPTAGYHAYVPGQHGAQVPSHLSRFGIGDLSPDDIEGVVEPIDDLDGWMEDLRLPEDAMARWAALGAMGAFAFAYAAKRKKQRQTALTVGLIASAATLWYGKQAVDQEATAGF